MIAIPIILALVVAFLFYVNKWPFTKKLLDRIVLKIPLVKNFVILTGLSNYIAVLKVAFDAGINIIDSLILSGTSVENVILNQVLRDIPYKIQQGQSLTNALKVTNVVPGIIMCMIATGEQSGQLGEMLGQSTTYIDTEIDNIVDLLNRLFEPILLLGIGVIVLLLALALYLPLFGAYANMG